MKKIQQILLQQKEAKLEKKGSSKPAGPMTGTAITTFQPVKNKISPSKYFFCFYFLNFHDSNNYLRLTKF